MEKKMLYENIQDIFRDIFDDESLIITDETTASDIDDWDSFNHVNLIVAIEAEFKIKFNFEELATLKNVGTIVDLVFKKKNS